MSNSDVDIHWIAGNCPVQAEGTVRGIPFYFRARGRGWTFEAGSPDSSLYHRVTGQWGDGPFDAGYMSDDIAEEKIRLAARKYCQHVDAWKSRKTPRIPIRGAA